jgi:hypothetical protein
MAVDIIQTAMFFTIIFISSSCNDYSFHIWFISVLFDLQTLESVESR